MDDREYAYDVGLSFAGEQRDYVEGVADALRSRGIRVFFDTYEKAALWGKNLYEHLSDVYQNRCRYCILFVSADYARKSGPIMSAGAPKLVPSQRGVSTSYRPFSTTQRLMVFLRPSRT